MPRITMKHVVSFTSEDPKNPADNLLKPEDYYKWRCATPGENKGIVVLQFEKATQIHSVDVGNNGSAFVEILVGRSSWDPGDEYKVLLVASSFMSPSESKSGTSTSRVRMFGPDKLNKTVAAEKWDRVKVVCTQPYNKTECYGLSFVAFHSPPEEEKEKNKDVSANTLSFKNKIGKFTLKEDCDVDEIQIGSYFAKRLQHGASNASLSTAASARHASSSIRLSALTSSSPSILASVRKADHATTFKPKEDILTTPKREPKNSASSTDAKEHSSSFTSSMKQTKAAEGIKLSEKEPKKNSTKLEPSKRKFEVAKETKKDSHEKAEVSAPPAKKTKRKTKNRKLPFHRLMRDVVFVLSGYKNPQRSDLREAAISMGAQYRPDWGSGCTHLICAFKNTPKFNQVLGKGKIVSHKWITDCEKKQERFSIKDYRIDGGASSSDSGSDSDNNNAQSSHAKASSVEEVQDDTKTNVAHIEMDEPMPGPSRISEDPNDDEYNTEDELRRAREAMSCSMKNDDDDEYGGSTEDESDSNGRVGKVVSSSAEDECKPKANRPDLPPLPDYFNREKFLIFGDFEPVERRRLLRYITAYNGVVCDYMSDDIRYVISDKGWGKSFDEAAASNPSLEFIHADWIIECHEEGKCVSSKDFQIKRSA